VVVFGHSHIPVVDDDGDLLMLNPGSPTDRRRMPTFTLATLDLEDGAVAARLVDLGLEHAVLTAAVPVGQGMAHGLDAGSRSRDPRPG
jgi:hypothetical protein